jgi:hypothetical protein
VTGPAQVRAQVTGTAEIRRAASSCCAAPLTAGPADGVVCRQCGQLCGIVHGPPEEVTLNG